MTDLSAALTDFVRTTVVSDPDAEVSGTTELLLEGLVDSLGVVQIVHWLEERLGAPIDPADVTIDNFGSIDQMIAFAATVAPVG